MLEGDDSDGLLAEEGRAPEVNRWRVFAPYVGGLGAAVLFMIILLSLVLFLEMRRREAALPPQSATIRKWQERFAKIPNPEKYAETLKTYTSTEHRAGTPGGYDIAVQTQTMFEKEGIPAQMYRYDVLLSYPLHISAKLLFPVTHDCAVYETPIESDPTSANAAAMPAYNGYSGSGTAVGELIYVNYGRREDFELLDREGISVKDRIVIARYGENFRGIKAMLAAERGAVGLLIYSDPADDGFSRGPVYPDGPWRPPQGIQRGSVQYSQSTYPGDPTTPGRPSVAGVSRLPLERANIPHIPVQPIGYGDAEVLLRQLRGNLPHPSWQGGLNFSYALGPGPAQFNLSVYHNYTIDPIWNVIGKIEGYGDPSKSVIIGNHHDAWNFGGRDPASGSAALAEITRSFGTLMKEGWKPYRSIILASWDAEEQGLVGSTEWVEEFGASLSTSVIAYLNVDSAASGYYFSASIVPSLASVLRSTLELVADPTPGQTRTLLQAAIADAQFSDPQATNPKFTDLGSGSDFTPFFQHLGLPATDFAFHGVAGVYHSIYDSYTWIEQFGDPGFRTGPTMANVLGLLAIALADSLVLPFDYTDYGVRLQEGISELRKLNPKINDTQLVHAVSLFVKAAAALQKHINGIRFSPWLRKERLEALNARLVLAEQQFLYAAGLNGRPFFKHAIFAPGVYTGYAARIFPDVREAVDSDDLIQASFEATRAAQVIYAAASYLDDTRF